jgi:hypothetical protein
VRDARPLAGSAWHDLPGNSPVLQLPQWTRVAARSRADVPVSYPPGTQNHFSARTTPAAEAATRSGPRRGSVRRHSPDAGSASAPRVRRLPRPPLWLRLRGTLGGRRGPSWTRASSRRCDPQLVESSSRSTSDVPVGLNPYRQANPRSRTSHTETPLDRRLLTRADTDSKSSPRDAHRDCSSATRTRLRAGDRGSCTRERRKAVVDELHGHCALANRRGASLRRS